MRRSCFICNKRTLVGFNVSRKGLAKKKGGTGSKITRRTKRVFRVNLRRVWIKTDKKVKHVYVCVECLKKGKAEIFSFKKRLPASVAN